MVDRGERGDVADELIEQSGLQQVCFFGDQRLLSEHHVLGSGWVCGEESPVDEASVPIKFCYTQCDMLSVTCNISWHFENIT